MTRLAQYIEAAERVNTRRSYASAIRHFEIEWKGLLPSTSDTISRYLADYAPTLAINTLRQRLAALSRWHTDQGFPDPTKSALVRQVLKGIRSVHTAPEKRARPLELAVLQQVDQWLDTAISNAQQSGGVVAVRAAVGTDRSPAIAIDTLRSRCSHACPQRAGTSRCVPAAQPLRSPHPPGAR